MNEWKKYLQDKKRKFSQHQTYLNAIRFHKIRDKDEEMMKIYDKEEISYFDIKYIEASIFSKEEKLSKMEPNLSVLDEYNKRERDFEERSKELNLVTTEREEKKKLYNDLRKQRLDEFLEGFNSISLKLKEMYQMITLGGNAELELVDSLDPFSEGIIFSVMPPKKSWKNISNLSGGEKVLCVFLTPDFIIISPCLCIASL